MSDQGRTSSEGAATWVLPSVRGPLISPRGRGTSPSALAAAERTSRTEGFDQGYRDGLQQAATETAARQVELAQAVAALSSLFGQLAAPLERLDDEAVREMTSLAISVGGHLARRELALDPSQVNAVVRHCVGLLPAGARDVRVLVNPQDAACIRARLAPTCADAAWTLLDDPVQPRGGCVVQSEHSRIDGHLEARLAAVMATMLGDARDASHQPATDLPTHSDGSERRKVDDVGTPE